MMLGHGLGLLLVAGLAAGHVSLLWPPARSLGLDFLDSFRTSGDCGVDDGDWTRTKFKAGSAVNVTWHLGYPHGGGYRLELISPTEGLSMQILPAVSSDTWQTEEARFSQSHVVNLPQGVECNNCYLRLERQATEWGKSYKFRSCADVVIVSGAEEDCGQGTSRQGGGCACPRGWEGDRCQYKTECKSDNDCNGPKGQGKCIITDSAVFRSGQCFCAAGWQGAQCEVKSMLEGDQARQYNKDEYQAEVLGKDVELLWKRLGGGELEMIVSAKTTSWVGFGWRPSDSFTKSCQEFPTTLPKPLGKDFHPMDCTDMVVGSANQGLSRVGDYYTRDRSTPRLDRDYGGEDDLTSAYAWEEDGVTTVRMIKKSQGGVADHPLQGKLHFIWAHGQDSDFYKPDQLKYHGGKGDQRGITVIDLGGDSVGVSPLQVGLGVSCVLLILLVALQVVQNFDKKLSCLNPYKLFSS